MLRKRIYYIVITAIGIYLFVVVPLLRIYVLPDFNMYELSLPGVLLYISTIFLIPNKKRIRVLYIIIIAVVTSAALGYGITRANATDYKVEKNISDLMNNLEKSALDDPKSSMSSNPYTYVVNNEYYDNIVKLGISALPAIRENIKNSKNNGLREYILAIAGEEIAKVDLKGDSFKWATGKAWVNEWDSHLKNLVKNVDSISSADVASDEKIERLIKLGMPSVPFIMDKIEGGQAELVPALEALLEGNADVPFEKGTVKDYKEWIRENKYKFASLREIVEKAKDL